MFQITIEVRGNQGDDVTVVVRSFSGAVATTGLGSIHASLDKILGMNAEYLTVWREDHPPWPSEPPKV